MELVFLVLIWEIVLLLVIILDTAFDYTCPSFITLTMFLLSTISLILNYQNWNVTFSLKTCLILICALTNLVLIEMFVRNYHRKNVNYREDGGFTKVIEESPWITDGVMKSIILVSSLLMMVIYIKEIGSIGSSLNLTTMISAIGAVKQSEYHTSTIATLCLRIGYALAGLYGFIFCHNVIVAHDKVRKNVYLLISMFAGVVSSFYSGSRGMMVGTIFSFIFYFIIFSRIVRGWKEFNIKKYLKYIIPVGILFIIVFYFSRSIVKNREYTSGIIEYITYYLGNSQQLLNLAVENTAIPFPSDNGLPGLYTFQFLYNELDGLGLISLPERISSGFLYLNRNTLVSGNVYTLFGEPYNDFGFIGMIVYVALFYFIFSHYYYRYIRYWRNTQKSKIILLIYGTQYYLVFFTFYLAPTIWVKLQTFATIIIVLIAYQFFRKCKFKV